MSTFRPPLTTFTPYSEKTQQSIDALLNASEAPSCLRLDLFVSSTTDIRLIKDGVSFFQLDEKGCARCTMSHEEMPEGIRDAYLNVLAHINIEPEVTDMLEGYPLPWGDGLFCKGIDGHHLSLLMMKDRIGAVIQEYLPNWLGDTSDEDYFSPESLATDRAEVMSVFIPEPESNHAELKSVENVAKHHEMLAGMFFHHLDHAQEVTFLSVNPEDRI
jgi:hypothetical protein